MYSRIASAQGVVLLRLGPVLDPGLVPGLGLGLRVGWRGFDQSGSGVVPGWVVVI